MYTCFKVSSRLRETLRKPLGYFIAGPNAEFKAKKYIENINPVRIVTIGDVVSSTLYEAKLHIDIVVVDGKTLRSISRYYDFRSNRIFRVENHPGTISINAWNTLREALKINGDVLVLVDGEEDLLVIPVVILAPENSVVAYGQPPLWGEGGIVIVKVNMEKKREFINYLREMDVEEGSREEVLRILDEYTNYT
ncbi:MAG: GTP-dependent dephospho-CoA kinase family protein [Candidatus Methanomethylicia archaeon]